MIEFNFYGLIATCLVGAFLLGFFNDQVQRQGWFSKVMIAGVLSTLLSLLPSLQKGVSLNWGVCYILVGILILNSALLLGFSFLSDGLSQSFGRMHGFVRGIPTSNIWGLTRLILGGVVNFLFNLSLFLWAIISYPARQKKVLALPQGTGDQLVF